MSRSQCALHAALVNADDCCKVERCSGGDGGDDAANPSNSIVRAVHATTAATATAAALE